MDRLDRIQRQAQELLEQLGRLRQDEQLRDEVEPRGLGPQARLLLGLTEAAAVLGIGETLLRELVAARDIPSIQLGRRPMIPVRRLLDWIDAQVDAGGAIREDARERVVRITAGREHASEASKGKPRPARPRRG